MDMFIADTHFGHEGILAACRPQFKTIEEMNMTIIENINRKMRKNDTLYILGDFAFHSKTPPTEFLEAIRPRKVLVMGNHDKDWLRCMTDEEKEHWLFRICEHSCCMKKNKIELYLNHFPRLAWNRSHYFGQSFSICGHIHAKREESVAARLFPQVPCQFNAGVDVNHFEPVTFAELIENNVAFYGLRYSEEEQARIDDAVQKVMNN